MTSYTFRLKNGKYKTVYGSGLALINGKAIIREATGHWNADFGAMTPWFYEYPKLRTLIFDRELLLSIDGKPFTLFK